MIYVILPLVSGQIGLDLYKFVIYVTCKTENEFYEHFKYYEEPNFTFKNGLQRIYSF